MIEEPAFLATVFLYC